MAKKTLTLEQQQQMFRADDYLPATDELDRKGKAMDAKWGVGRLPDLVSPDLKARFERQWQKLHDAIAAERFGDALALIPGTIRGWDALDAEATKLGHQIHTPVVWDVKRGDKLYKIVGTIHETHSVTKGDWDIVSLEELLNLNDAVKRGVFEQRSVPDYVPAAAVDKRPVRGRQRPKAVPQQSLQGLDGERTAVATHGIVKGGDDLSFLDAGQSS